jgi:tripartite-type tricarboxylate transporter receptor subunit TctC
MKVRLLAYFAAFAFAWCLVAGSEARAWQPTKPIEAIIQTSPGVASDIYMRTWISIVLLLFSLVGMVGRVCALQSL